MQQILSLLSSWSRLNLQCNGKQPSPRLPVGNYWFIICYRKKYWYPKLKIKGDTVKIHSKFISCSWLLVEWIQSSCLIRKRLFYRFVTSKTHVTSFFLLWWRELPNYLLSWSETKLNALARPFYMHLPIRFIQCFADSLDRCGSLGNWI